MNLRVFSEKNSSPIGQLIIAERQNYTFSASGIQTITYTFNGSFRLPRNNVLWVGIFADLTDGATCSASLLTSIPGLGYLYYGNIPNTYSGVLKYAFTSPATSIKLVPE